MVRCRHDDDKSPCPGRVGSAMGRPGSGRAVPGTASRLLETAMKNRPMSRAGIGELQGGAARVGPDLVIVTITLHYGRRGCSRRSQL